MSEKEAMRAYCERYPHPDDLAPVTEAERLEVAAADEEDEDYPTRCPDGCRVEPDGYCPHGYRSLAQLAGGF